MGLRYPVEAKVTSGIRPDHAIRCGGSLVTDNRQVARSLIGWADLESFDLLVTHWVRYPLQPG